MITSRLAVALVVLSFSAVSARAQCGPAFECGTDADGQGATVNGAISASEYGPFNSYAFSGGGSGFGGQLGASTVLYLNSDAVNLYIGFTNLGVHGDGNQYVFYFQTRPGGHQPNGVDMNDTSDQGRANATRLSASGLETVTFGTGSDSNNPDFALVFNNRSAGSGGFSALFELKGAGTNHVVVTHTAAGLGTGTPEFSIPRASLGITSNVDFRAFNISADGYMSNEGIPGTGISSNIGYAAGQTHVFSAFDRFTLADFGDVNNPTQRVNATTLRMPQAAPSSSSFSYTTTNAFPTLSSFSQPLCLRTPPGETNRIFVVEKCGTISVVTNLANPGKVTFLDISAKTLGCSGTEEGLLSLAFHPGYATNGYFYVWYVSNTNTPGGTGPHDILARFQVSATNANYCNPTSEVTLIKQYDEASNHNGGDLHFGPDGYLYLSLGDEGSGNDFYNNGQVITNDFFAGLIRIDVDKKPGSLAPNPHPAINGATTNYAIPPDNPYVGATQFNGSAIGNTNTIRTEYYAVGLRNPFRFCFDGVTGELLLGDVGQGRREDVHLIKKGDNCGWGFREGCTPGPKAAPAPYNQTSLLQNASFETGTGTTGITSWIRGSGNETREATTGFGYSLGSGTFPQGNAALKQFGANSDLYQTNLAVTGGSTYLARGMFYHSSTSDAVSNSPFSTRMYMEIEWYDAGNVFVGSHTSATHSGATLSDAWYPMELTMTSPASATRATFHIKTDSDVGSGSIWADRFYFGLQSNFESTYAEPVLDYARSGSSTNIGRTITGGIVYRGDRFPELVGRYVFSDYNSGNVWSMTHDGLKAVTWGYLVFDDGIAGFGEDPRNGDVLMADLGAGQVKRLAYASVSTNFPQTLADCGVFSDLVNLTPYPGIVPFEINVPFWSDNALKSRWFSVPSTNQAIGFSAESAWSSPTGTIWIKHFDLLLTSGVPSSARRLETRILVKNNDGNGGYGVTYRWGSSVTNATLVADGGLDEAIVINDGGTITTQLWRYPGRSECLQCHQATPGLALGFNTPQLNKDRDYNGTVTNQIRKLNELGYFSSVVTNVHTLRALAHPTNENHGLEYRVRSYLQANCAQCHFPGPANWDARVFTALDQAGIVNGALNNNLGDANNRVVVPGAMSNSVMLTRISTRGANKMPPLGSNLVDTQGIAIITAWITGTLTNYETYAQWQVRHYGATNNPNAGTDVDFDGDGNANHIEYLTGTDPTNVAADDAWTFAIGVTNGAGRITFDRIAGRGFDVQGNTNLLTGPWESLDTPDNAPFFGAATEEVSVQDPQTNAAEKHYRIRVYAP
jgi:glucose/arabinose dehydrogenase